MLIKAVLFDLDGTLLPMDQNLFMKAYFGGLAKRLAPRNYDPKGLVDAIWKGSAAMIKNDGSRKNEVAFWDAFATIFGERVKADEPYFDAYYREDFDLVKNVCGFSPMARKVVDRVKEKGLIPVLATNPLFPRIATEARTRWAGLDPKEFRLVTTYENSSFCKPNPKYYLEIVQEIGVKPEECLMVGNDVDEDMIAESIGMRVFLQTDCLINKDGKDISVYPSGGFAELIEFLDTIA